MKNALIFLPETGIYPYIRTLSIAGDALKTCGYDIYIFHCNKSLYRCPIMPNYGMPINVSTQEKEEKCKYCASNLFKIVIEYGFNIIDGTEYDIKLNNLNDVLNKTPASQWDKIIFDDIPIGEIGKVDLALEIKVFNLEILSDEQISLYRKYILTSYKVYHIIDKIIHDYLLNIVLTYNPYSQNIAAYHACKKNGIIFKNITNTHLCGPSSKLIQINNGHPYQTYPAHVLHFDDGAKYPISPEAVSQSFNDSLFSMYGSSSHIFSSSKSLDIEKIQTKLGISTQKIIGVFTSSLDELVSLLSSAKIMDFKVDFEQLFTDQIEWLFALKTYFANREDVMVLVKVHPREFMGIESQNAKKMKEAFYNKDSSNFKFIWPDNDISTYDLMEIIDCCLISHSTVGFECAKLGIPTLSFIKNFNYPDSFVIDTATSKDEYFKKIENLLIKKSTLKDITYCCRYFSWIKLIYSLNLGDHLPKNFFDTKIGIRIKNKDFLVNILENNFDYIKYNIEKLKKAKNSEKEERNAVLVGIKNVIEKISFPENIVRIGFLTKLRNLVTNIFSWKEGINDAPNCIIKTLSRDIVSLNDLKNQTIKNDKLRFIIKDMNCVFLIKDGVIHKRHSKLLLKLIEILEGDK